MGIFLLELTPKKKVRVQCRRDLNQRFFEDFLTLGRVKVQKRWLLPMLIGLLAKVAGGVYEFYTLNIQVSGTFWSDPNRVFGWVQNQAFLSNGSAAVKWPLTFLGWDSAWYLSLMTKGYAVSSQSYTFSPGLSFASNLVNFVLQNPMISLVIVSLVFGIICIPLYQMLAENYMSRQAAFISALLFAFFPYLFVFTTVAYSEGLMLFFVLGAWVLFKKGRILEASALATLAPLTRTMGILIVFPMLYDSIRQKTHRIRNVLLSLLPVISLSAWFAGLGLVTGDPLAPVHTSEWNQLWTIRTLLFEGIPHNGVNVILPSFYQNPPIPTHWLLPFASIAAIILPVLLFYKLWKKDKALWIYASAGYLGILCFGAIVSTPRYISVIFPFFIVASSNFSGNKKSIIAAIILIAVFYVLSIELWLSFLGGQFVA